MEKGCILILGAPNDIEGNLSLIAKTRLIKGATELSFNPGFKILLTGGFGTHFNETNQPHWKYAKDFLINECSVSPDSFLDESIESTNTVEDIEKAIPIFQKYNFNKIILVTSEFHLKRVEYIIGKVLDFDERTIFYSGASDKELDGELLRKLCEHENNALASLKANYKSSTIPD